VTTVADAGTGRQAADYLSAAVEIGTGLVAQAIWSSDRCSWIGAEPVDLRNGDGGAGPTYRALGPILYTGSSGVGLFLAQLWALTGRDEFRRTALAAMRHALSRQDDVDPDARFGFYAGWSGLGAATLRAGLLLGSAELYDGGAALLADVGRRIEPVCAQGADVPQRQEFDLMSGLAGAIPGLALAWRCTGDEAIAEAAVAAAGWLARSARKARTGWSWRSPGLRNQHDLTGLSHGAAGVAVALIDAFRICGDDSFATGARNAMRYENCWLDTVEGNWPDFRENPNDRRARSFSTFWCHGAPGIALARLHALRYLGDPRWRADAVVALDTTRRTTQRLLDSAGVDFSLCHGLAGNAECLIEAPRVLDASTWHADPDIPRLVGEHGLDQYAGTGVAWPCGTHTEETPNLMLGLAGIGYFYLRLAVPQVPSVLLPLQWHRPSV
jgi:lantibiotic modifying enzyme